MPVYRIQTAYIDYIFSQGTPFGQEGGFNTPNTSFILSSGTTNGCRLLLYFMLRPRLRLSKVTAEAEAKA